MPISYVFMLIHTELLSNVSGLGLKKTFGPRPCPRPLVQIQTMCQTVLMRLPPITPLMTTYQRWPNLSPLSMGDRLSILVHLKLLNQLESPILGQVVRCKMSRSQNCFCFTICKEYRSVLHSIPTWVTLALLVRTLIKFR